ncbi:siroheme synthase CysG [Inmirania thermothiophila]|uniref:Siroheme synthase n=1 Tax=Inmirania thermothiophila TaxID=1750597 RepID=A0A3N1XZX3_9GAMM|nr:siroheme synthase CysG [Inmirania thermothiophila]ROR32154.1 uroporphyrinogen-III C-methyltransferase /precorrin-2 dehydrogenase [Inmirania thermothiophila]
MDFLPIFMNVRGRRCLVVGGGAVASRKARLLLEAGARIEVVAPALAPALAELVEEGRVRHRPGRFEPALLDEAPVAVVLAATDDAEVNEAVFREAERRGIPVNVADRPALSTFILPSIIDRSPVVAAVSTGGASPVLARLIRARLETQIPAAYGRLAALVERFRDRVKAMLPDVQRRRIFWEEVLQGPIAERVFAGKEAEAEGMLERALAAEAAGERKVGEVYLVGGGPGDPDLLTFRAMRLMQQADVVVYDRLVAPAILELTRRDADRIYVGKARSRHAVPQEEINALLVRLAREGRRVLRLKGGDPFIFGRGGEEIETLMDEGIPFQVVPGITAASGCAAYAGIPLTHRDHAHACVFVTGHLKDGAALDLNWPALAQPGQTVVFYMGLHGAPVLAREMIRHGRAPQTPVALVQKGTTPEQRVVETTLEGLPRAARESGLEPPTLIIVGEVVRLREKLAWFEPAPTL